MLNHLLYILWGPSAEALHIGPVTVKWYGLCWASSLFACFYLTQYIFRKTGRNEEKITTAIQYIFVFGLMGSRLAHVIFYNLDYYLANPLEIPMIWRGGLASHGGVVGGLLGLYIFCRRNKEFSFFWLMDHGIIAIPIMAALIRFGNLMNSELYGKHTTLPWAFIFEQVDNVPRHPVVLYESISYLLIQLLMLYAFTKIKESKPGIYIGLFMALIFTIRFALEFTKEPDAVVLGGLISSTQALDLPFMLAGYVLTYLALNNKLKYPETEAAYG
ncbi:MAG TPA: prolipoprotein diacylglyceryl transferase [Chitinophagales bacterium]|nr:prolipoprotein diacylglyceryl transferase [Chitinophagales bacterium]